MNFLEVNSCGSSPHLRGNPVRGWAKDTQGWGHPRSYGATSSRAAPTLLTCGSSPHLRGNQVLPFPRTRSLRVIPAPTGQPFSHLAGDRDTTGHPRTYGATLPVSLATGESAGSSPHLRGNQILGGWSTRRRRVIPAPTGQPGVANSLSYCLGGHPRTYGATW